MKDLDRNTKQGLEAEKLVFEKEKGILNSDKRLANFQDRLRHVFREDGDGDGYDIISCEYDEKTNEVIDRYVEVKSTRHDKNSPFYLTENELNVAKKEGKLYHIYRLYKNDDDNWDYYVIDDVYKNIQCKPIKYRAIPKN
ncbi:DUF3883 domain-containing protein [Lactobacillus terrae]|uniref:DUF3883 domain-containing protein n=1 Tax=Lactobacillus terrae TaxID=2269374 RepID=UPI000C1B7021|nr:DUF3883 domain-containing protein [Lactobacillus terrae]